MVVIHQLFLFPIGVLQNLVLVKRPLSCIC